MTSKFVRWCAASCFTLLLAACGGGGSDGPAARSAGPADSNGPTTSCLPTFAHYDALRLNTTPEQVTAAMGCEGRRINEATIDNAKWVSYDWGSQNSGPYLYASFIDGFLADVTATGLLATGPAACLPTREAVDQLKKGMTAEEVSRVVGCPGELFSVNRGISGEMLILTWGVDDRGPFLLANFEGGRLSTTTAMRL